MPIVLGLGEPLQNPLGLANAPGLTGPEPSAAPPIRAQTSPAAAPSPIASPVAAPTPPGIAPRDMNLAVDTIISEALGEGPEGMAAVASVIKNRATERGKSLGAIVSEKDQFSPPGDATLKAMRDPTIRAEAEKILTGVLAGEIPDPTGGADHFHADYLSPSWAKNMPETAKIGRHVFYNSRAEAKPAAKASDITVSNAFAPEDALGLNKRENPFDAVLTPAADSAPTVPNPDAKGLARLVRPEPMEPDAGAKAGTLSFAHKGQDRISANFRTMLEQTSAEIGAPLMITSGFRGANHPVEARKAAPGQHSHGTAADISMRGMSDQQRQALVESLLAKGAKRFITYSGSPDMLHVDLKDQRGDGQPYFMHDKSARFMDRAPGWFKQIAASPSSAMNAYIEENPQRSNPAFDAALGGDGKPASTPTGATIIVDGAFKPANDMNMLGGDTPFRAAPAAPVEPPLDPRAEAVTNRIETQNFSADREAARLNQEQGSDQRYQAMTEDQARQFSTDWEAQNRSSGDLGDIGRQLGAGNAEIGLVMDEITRKIPIVGEKVANAVAGIDEWITGRPMKARLRDYADRADASLTPQGQASMQKKAIDSDKFLYIGDALTDPRWYIGVSARSAPSMAATMGVSGLVARGAFLRATAAGMSERQAAAKAARAATIAGGITEGGYAGGQSSLSVKEKLRQLPRETLLQSEAVQSLMEQGLSEDEAVNSVIEDASTQAFIYAGVSSAMFGGLGDRAMAKIIAEGVGGSLAKRVAAGAARNAPAEALEEAGQSATQQLSENAAVQTVDPSQSLTEGVGEAAVSGAAAGAAMGGTIGALGGAASSPTSAGEEIDYSQPSADGAATDTPPTAPAGPAPQQDAATPPMKKGGLAEAVQAARDKVEARVRAPRAPSDAPEGAPPAGSTVRIVDDGLDLVTTIDSWRDGEAVIYDSQTGEVMQVPPSTIAEVISRPGDPLVSRTRTIETPPASEDMPATAAADGSPAAGSRVILDAPGMERQAARVDGYTPDAEAVVTTDDGKQVQVPVETLKVNKLKPEQVAKQDEARNPPVEREKPEPTSTRRTVFNRTVELPDERHAQLFDLAVERLQTKRLLGKGQLDKDRVMPAEQARLAREFGVTPEDLGQMADDYRFRVERAAKTAKSDLPQKLPPVNAELLKRMQRDAAKAATPDAAEIDAAPAATDPVTVAAQEAATSPTNDIAAPTPAQIEAGNYKKGHIRLGGLDISVENPAGSTRSGKSRSGKAWEVEMKSHYGYIKGTVGRDKDHIDVFVRPGVANIADDAPVYVVDQRDPARGRFDEHKVMIGWDTPKAARDAYLENYSKDWKGMSAVTPTTLGEFKTWLKEGDTNAPFAPKWFGTREKAEEYIRKENLKGYEVQPNGLRFEVKKTPKTVAQPAPAAAATKPVETQRTEARVAKPVAQEPAPEPSAQQEPDQFANNKLFTADKVAAARARLKSKMSQLNSGIDPEILIDGMTIAGAYIEAGIRNFGDYAKAMVGDFGPSIQPYLLSFWEGARNYPGLDTAGMTDVVESARQHKQMTEQPTGDTVEPEPVQETTNAEPAKLDQPGARALEGAPGREVPAAAKSRETGRGSDAGGRADADGGRPARAERVQAGRSVPDGQGELPVSAGVADAGTDAAQIEPRNGGRGAARAKDNADRVKPTADALAGVETAATPAQNRADNFTITDADGIGQGGQKTKFKNNVAAIELLRRLDSEARPATRDEQAVLARWVGWGGLQAAFYRQDGSTVKGWEKEAKQLKELLTPEEYRAAESSTRNAHYTAPDVVNAMWRAVERLGFAGGQVLEPSVGAGNFLGLMPAKFWNAAKVTGVELDHITGALAKNLYPNANIQAPIGFQDFIVPDGYFDLAIGNPPFGSEKLYDKTRRDLNKFSIHNFFFAKSIEGLRPGGVLAMVITNRFMDGQSVAARSHIARSADLIGAIRLPNNAFQKNAGTEVTTDIVFLRKRMPGEAPQSKAWLEVQDYRGRDGTPVPLNRYFIENPDMMLGDFGAYGTMYGPDEPALVARSGSDLTADLTAAIERLPQDIMTAPGVAMQISEPGAPANVRDVAPGSMFLADDGAVHVRKADSLGEAQAEKVDLQGAAAERAGGMIRIRDTFAKLRKAQIDERATDQQIENLRGMLNKQYDVFVKKHGPINSDANKRIFRDDPTWPQLSALEDSFDRGVSKDQAKKTGEAARQASAKKAAIFSKRTQQPYRRPERADTAKDALAQSLGEIGRVDIDNVARLYGKTADETVKELGPLLYKTPSGAYETADQYLSGNVKKKLADAERAAADSPEFNRNVDALRAVIPSDIDAVDIDVKPGAPWIPPKHIEDFMRHIAEGAGGRAVYSRGTAKWVLDAPRSSAAADVQWGTSRARLSTTLDAAINGSNITITDRFSDGTSQVNREETDAANEKVAKIRDEWRRWLWQDDARRDELARLYNDVFNTDVQRVFDGAHLQFPGKVSDDIISLRPHQKSFVWRVLQSSTTLADHTVGAGKTFALIASAMELRRTGLAKKPVFVVPNHLVGQWASDFIKLYPGAKVLATTKRDFEKENRKRLFARIATGDWDAVVVAHSSFGKIGVAPDVEAKFIQEQIADIEDSEREMRMAGGESGRNVKQLAKRRETLQTKLKKMLDAGAKDEGLTFDELGVDALFVDEAHEFKNLGFVTSMTRVAGLGNPQGSQKAADLYMKIQIVKQRTGGRNVVFATGTPLSNTMAEMFTVQRYLDYAGLQALGITHFDAWAKVFGEVVTDWELSPSGQYKLNSRFAKFVNMPELMQRYLSFADVITNDDIKRQLAEIGKTLPLPKVKGGKPTNVVVPRSPDQARFIGEARQGENGEMTFPEGSLVYRAEHLPKKAEKGADNMLKVMSDARKAALDMRLIEPGYRDHPGSKVHIAADNIRRIYDQWAEQRGTQLVFIDLSTPKKAMAKEEARIRDLMKKADEGDEAAQEALDKMSPDEFMALDSSFSVYDDLRQKLIDRGIPVNEIAFIHDANTELQKEELFGKVRSGRVRVLLGSTPKMGAGTNVQNRLVALHHLDAPWRPSDLEQRDGRGIRQGNELYNADPEGFEIEILRYATENTLDARQWQTIEAKARFIQQVRKGGSTSREIEDIGGEAANAAEMKAAASGNPLILEEMDTRRKLRKLEDAQREHQREQYRIRSTMRTIEQTIEAAQSKLPTAEKDAAMAGEVKAFTAMVDGKTIEKPKEFGEAVNAKMRALMDDFSEREIPVGTYGPFSLSIEGGKNRFDDSQVVTLTIKGAGEHQITFNDPKNVDPTGLGQRVRNTVAKLADQPDILKSDIEAARAQLPRLEAQIGEWSDAGALQKTAERHRELLDQLKPKKKDQAAPAAAGDVATIGPEVMDAPFGWISADTKNDVKFTVDDFRAVEKIIAEVSGLASTKWQDRIGARAGDRNWGDAATIFPAGVYNTIQDAITISRDYAYPSVAFHESFHRLQNLFLTEKERAVLRAERGRLRRMVATIRSPDTVRGMAQVEIEAEAFAAWATNPALRIKPHKGLAAAWAHILETARRIRNYLLGRGFIQTEDVFQAARSGEAAKRTPSNDPALAIGKFYAMAPEQARSADDAVTAGRIVSELKGRITDIKPTLMAAVPLNYFAELAQPNMTAVKDYLRVKRGMDAYRGKKHAEADDIAQAWMKFNRLGLLGKDKTRAKMVSDLMHESTLSGIDPSKTDEETTAKPGYAALRKQYMALPPAGRAIYERVRDYYVTQADELDEILLDNVRKSMEISVRQAEAAHQKEVERINKSGLKGDKLKDALDTAAKEFRARATRAKYTMKARLTMLRVAFESSRVPAPYFPLGRFGQYFVAVRDVNGELLSFSKFEKASDRDRAAAKFQREFPAAVVKSGVMREKENVRDAMDPRMLAEINEILGAANVSEDVMDQIYQRYLETMPDLSARKRFIHRSGVAGFAEDALRVFSHTAFHGAHQMAKTKYGMELGELVNNAHDQADEADDQTSAMRLANELSKRHDWVMNPTGGAVATLMTSTAFVWMMAASPAAAIVNSSQTILMGGPILGARFGGLSKALPALLRASADFVAGRGSAANAKISAEEKRALEVFYESGLIDRTQSHDLAGIGETGVEYSPVRTRVMGIISWAFHKTEVFNREVTALAAYRLARANGLNQSDAIDAAHDLTWKTHFDLSNSSRPRVMQNDFAKVALVFRSYQINMLYRLFRDLHQSLRGASPAARKEARYQLAGVLGMQAVMAGVTGVAGFNLALGLASLVMGDDDDPMDFEMQFKRSVLDILGPELGGIALNGVPGHYAGVNLTDRIGMPDLWFRSPGRELQGKDEWQYWMSQALGAAPSIGERMFYGFDVAMDGDVARGVEIAAPKAIGDLMKAYRYAEQGLTNTKGDEILSADQIDVGDILRQASGFSPAKVNEAWERKAALENAETKIHRRRQQIVNRFALAIAMGDDEARKEALEEVRAFNAVPINRTMAITSDTLKRSLATRARNRNKREDGALIENQALGAMLRKELPDRVY